MSNRPKTFKAIFRGVQGEGMNMPYFPRYPLWLYKDGVDPLLVKDTCEEDAARQDGFDSITAGILANKHLINWFWDLEDMSARQLKIYAQEEYGVDLPVEAGQEKLFKAVCELTRHAPQNRNRLVLMAHTIKMNYDATLAEIERMLKPGALGVESETETFEVWA